VVKVLQSTNLYSGAVSIRRDRFSLRGRIIDKEIVEHQPSVGIVPVVGRDVILVTQYRHAAGRQLLEIPAGKIEGNESPLEAAKREMAEEIGFAGVLQPILRCYLAPGYDTEFIRIYVATKLVKVSQGKLDDDENISTKKIGLDQAIRMCLSGRIQDCKTIAGLLAYSKSKKSLDC
jgi:ADP-ribose pyrophosphatase